MCSARGQATAEYVALVALVAVALALAAGLTSGGLASQVLGGLQRGLCHVVGGDCARPIAPRADLAPCPLLRTRRVEELRETLAVVRLGASGTLRAVRTSDGHVTVTLEDEGAAGGEIGAGLRLRAGRRAFGGTASAALVATWASGRAWTFPDAAAARRFVAAYGSKATIGGKLVDRIRSRCSLLCDAIGWRPHPQLPEPDEVHEAGGASVALTASFGLGASVRLDGKAATVLGRTVRRDGTTTWFLRLDASATAGLGLGELAGVGGLSGRAVLAYTLDRRGRPLTLSADLAGAASAAVELEAKRAAGRASAGVDAMRGAEVELDATLDLREPANRAVATSVLGALTHLGALPARVRSLAARFATRGQLDRRVYALQTTAGGVGASIGLGVEVGAAFERTTEGLRLLSAETRLPGLPFLPRDDCRPA